MTEKRKLIVIHPHTGRIPEQQDIVEIAQGRSAFWDEFIDRNPLAQAGWYNALIGWLAGAYPDEFGLDLSGGSYD